MTGALIKINIKMVYAGLFRRYKKGKKLNLAVKILIGLLVIYVAGALLITVGLMFNSLCGAFFEAGISWFYFTMSGLMIFALCFVGSFFMVQTQLFNARDNELLLSMPVKPGAILAGRLAALLVFEYIYEIIVFVPVFAVLIISGYITYLPVMGIVFYILSGLLLPLPALAVGCLFGWVVALLTSRMRSKKILTFIMTLAFLFVYFWLYSSAARYISILTERGAEIADAVRRALLPAYHLGVAATTGGIINFAIFAVFAIVPFAIMSVLLSRSFITVATANKGGRKVVYREKRLSVSGAGTALLKKELLRFFTNPMYILNAALGAIIIMAGAIVLIVMPELITNVLEEIEGMLPGVTPGIIAAVILTGVSGLNIVSAPAISLEGNKLGIIKSLPVTGWTVLKAKLGPHIIAGGIPAVMAWLAYMLRLPVNGVLEASLIIIAPLSVTVLTGLFGITLNLIFNRFDWINEMQPIKQGMSSMLALFGSMAVLAALAVIYALILKRYIAIDKYLVLCVILFIVLSGGLYIYLKTGGVRRYNGLE